MRLTALSLFSKKLQNPFPETLIPGNDGPGWSAAYAYPSVGQDALKAGPDLQADRVSLRPPPKKAFQYSFRAWLAPLLALACFSIAFHSSAEDLTQNASETRGRLANQQVLSEADYPKLKFSPVSLRGGGSLMLISPEQWSPLGQKLTKTLEKAHQRFESLIGTLPPLKTSLRLMDQETFHLSTGAPRWTNALYFKGQIIIPLSPGTRLDYDNITRSIRHEYAHAIIHALSNGKCPGWLDEGLAQWAEGPENPALKPALAAYLSTHRPIPLELLQGGFTRLDTGMVAAAYAQSLIATQAMIETFGFKRIRNYLLSLRDADDKRKVFATSFNMQEQVFENKLHAKLVQWAESYNLIARN